MQETTFYKYLLIAWLALALIIFIMLEMDLRLALLTFSVLLWST